MSFIQMPLTASGLSRPAALSISEMQHRKLDSGHALESAKTAGIMKKRIKILLVDDHPVVRKGIRSCLAHDAHLEVVGEAADGHEALRKAKELAPDIVLMDIDMPQMNGLAATELMRKELPQVKVLILSMHQHTEYVLRILRSGASG